jgi:hypothetical protein
MRDRIHMPGGIEVLPEVHDEPPEVRIWRPRGLSERIAVVRANELHALIIRADGTVEDLGVSHNLRTTVGLDWESNILGGNLPVVLGAATSITANSVTKTAAGWTVDAFKGMRVVMPVTGVTTEPVYGNIGTNSATVITVDQWSKSDDTVGTTPAGTNAMLLLPGMGPARYIGITSDATTPAAADTALTSELNANGLARSLSVYAHTPGASSYTRTKTWTMSGAGPTSVVRAGMFTAGTLAAGGLMIFSTNLNTSASLSLNDQLALTWTVNH